MSLDYAAFVRFWGKTGVRLRMCVSMSAVLLCLTGFLGAAAHAQTGPSTSAPGKGLADVPPGVQASALATDGAVSSVGPGDVLSVVVYGQPDLTARVTVTAEGEMTVPFLGVLQVAGQSPGQIARRIEKGLHGGGFLLDPQVSVEVTEVRSQVVSILGQVQRAGRYAIHGNLSLLDLLALAGGVRDDAADRVVVMRRTDSGAEGTPIEVSLDHRAPPSSEARNLQLQRGDVVFVPTARRFFVYGEVNRPGAYPMEKGMTVMRAVSLAGGLAPKASDRSISINRKDESTGEDQKIVVKMTDAVEPGDVVHVDERWF